MKLSLPTLTLMVALCLGLLALIHPARAQDGQDLFEHDRLATLAEEYGGDLVRTLAADTTSISVLLLQSGRAAETKKWSVVRDNLEKIVARNPQSAATWLRLARAWRASDPGNVRAAAAAYRAYDLAPTESDRLEALFVLGDVAFEVWTRAAEEDPGGAFEWRTMSKLIFAQIGQSVADSTDIADKISAMDKSALRIVETGNVYAGVQYLRRVADKSPPLCVTFAEPLVDDLDQIRRFVVMDSEDLGRAGAARAVLQLIGDELCATDLAWGAQYSMTLKAGLPGISGLTLPADRTIEGRVPAAEPVVGFNASDYILPRTGAGLVALKAINVRDANLNLLRIADRPFLRSLVTDGLDTKVTFSGFRTMKQGHGEPVWSGKVALSNQINAEFMARVPVGSLVQAWEAAARAGDGVPPAAMLGGDFSMDLSRPDTRGQLGPAAYALVIDEVTPFDLEDISAVTEGEVEWVQDPLEQRLPVQWLVRSDLGISLMRADRWVHVVVRHLSDGSAAGGATIELLANNGRVLGAETADAQGTARFERRLLRGVDTNEFQAVAAYEGDDFGFLLADEEYLNLTDLAIGGREHSGLIDVFVAPERQIYRPGDTVSALVLARTANGAALGRVPPLVVTVESDSGVVAGRLALADDDGAWTEGGRLAALTLAPTAPIGPATIRVRMAGLPEVISERPLQIRHFKPDRAKVRLVGDWSAQADGNRITVAGAAVGEYLYGLASQSESAISAPVREAPVEAWVDLKLTASPHPTCYSDYTFGDDNESPPVLRRKVNTLLRTDATGRVALSADIANVPTSSRPRAVVPSVQLLDAAGVIARFQSQHSIPVREDRNWVGVRLAPFSNPATTGKLVFDIVSTNGALAPVAATLNVRVVRERTTYVWSGTGSGWDYHPSVQTFSHASRVARLSAGDADSDGCLRATTLEFDSSEPLPLGSYRVELSGADGAVVSALRFRVGADSDPRTPAKPQVFPVQLSEGSVVAGARLSLAATDLSLVSGHVLFGLARGGEVAAWVEADIRDGAARTEFSVPQDWEGSFVHVFATAYGKSVADAPAVARAVGLSSFRVEASRRELDLVLQVPANVGSADATVIDVSVLNADASEATQVVLYAVDEGIHSITGYETPEPYEFFHGGHAFPFDVQDVYGRLIKDAEGAILGENGGDLFPDFRGEGYTSRRLALQVLGPVTVIDGKARFDLAPFEFTGQVRLDAFAWTAARAGSGQASLRVLDTLELSVGAPGYVHAGDGLTVPVILRNISQGGTSQFSLVASVTGAQLAGGQQFIDETLTVGPSQAQTVSIRIDVPQDAFQPVDISVTVADETGFLPDQINRTVRIDLRNPEVPRTKMQLVKRLESGETSTVTIDDLMAALGPVSGLRDAQVSFQVAAVGRMPDMAGLLIGRDGDAQASRDIRNIASEGILRLAANLDGFKADDILALQTSDGGFMATPIRTRVPILAPGLSMGDQLPLLDPMWRSAIALDYLQYAEGQGQAVPATGLNAAKGFLSTSLRRYLDYSQGPQEICRREIFFSALVLARANAIDRQSYESLLSNCRNYGSPQFDVALFSAFLLAYGDVKAANEVMAANFSDAVLAETTPLKLQELSMSIALLAENQAPPDLLDGLVRTVAVETGKLPTDIEPQTAAWMARAEQGLSSLLGSPDKLQLAVLPTSAADPQKTSATGWFSKNFDLAETAPRFDLTNAGNNPVDIFARIRLPHSALVRQDEGAIALRRRIFSTTGEELIPGSNFDIAQNDLAIVLIEGDLPQGLRDGQIRIAVPIPAGFEIEVSRLSADTLASLLGPAAKLQGRPIYFEAMQDRLLVIVEADIDAAAGTAGRFSYAFAARAVVEGDFTVPAALAEAVDDPAVFGGTDLLRISVAPAQ